MKIKVLFVCMGNICRSPAGEAILLKKIKTHNLEHIIEVDSAGIYGYHQGEAADERMQYHASKRGYELLTLSRQVSVSDGENFDIILAMDNSNIQDLKSIISPKYHEKIFLMNDFSNKYNNKEVPDPYYGGKPGFELVLDMLEDATEGLIFEIKEKINKIN